MKKQLSRILVTAIFGLSSFSLLQADTGGLASLRGTTDLDATRTADDYKPVPKDGQTIERDYLHQPPLIPHQVRDYRIDTNSNKCLSCHSWKNYKQTGATKISLTHFDTRAGKQLSDVSPRRYFCLQCHVTQANAKPLVDNEFRSVDAMSSE